MSSLAVGSTALTFCLQRGFYVGVDRQTRAKWFCLPHAAHLLPFAGHSSACGNAPPHHRHVLMIGNDLGWSFFSPIFPFVIVFTGSVLMGFSVAASMCDAITFDNSFERPNIRMSSIALFESCKIFSRRLLDAHHCMN